VDDLAQRFRRGDDAAIREVVDRYSGPVTTVVRSVLGPGDLVADGVQQTFVKAWRSADQFQGADLAPWLYSIARRTSIDLLRHERRPTLGGHEAEVDVSVDATTLDEVWQRHEIRRALDGLPPDEREVVRLSHLVGLTHPQIAEQLGIAVGTVKSRSSRAHKRLAAALRHLDPSANQTDAGSVMTLEDRP